MSDYDVIVLGAGAMGSASAYYLALEGQKVLLLEQFELDHQHGSSWGYTRIIRYTYDHPTYVRLARETYPLWYALEEEWGEKLIKKTGGIDFGMADDETLLATIENVRRFDLSHELFTPDEAMKHFPQFHFSEGMQVLYQKDTGLVTPSRAVRAHATLAQQHGAQLRTNEAVEHIDIHADGVTITTKEGRYRAGRLIVTAGAWAGRLLASIGVHVSLQPLACQEAQFQPPVGQEALYSPEQMPAYIYHYDLANGGGIYGIPNYEGKGVKSAFHWGKEYNHPSEVDYTASEEGVQNIRDAMGGILPFLQDAPVLMTRICLYTMTPDHHFILDHHPEHPHVIIGAGFSGHGFKFSTGIGKILTDLALRQKTSYDINLFRLSRFM